jgi:hypothetical protein
MCAANQEKYTFIASLTASFEKPVFPRTDKYNEPKSVSYRALSTYAITLHGNSVCIDRPGSTFDRWIKLEAAAWELLKNADLKNEITADNVNDSRPTDIRGEWASASGRNYVHPVASVAGNTRYIAVCQTEVEDLWIMACVEAVYDPEILTKAILEARS